VAQTNNAIGVKGETITIIPVMDRKGLERII
jgi:hypothetical protein